MDNTCLSSQLPAFLLKNSLSQFFRFATEETKEIKIMKSSEEHNHYHPILMEVIYHCNWLSLKKDPKVTIYRSTWTKRRVIKIFTDETLLYQSQWRQSKKMVILPCVKPTCLRSKAFVYLYGRIITPTGLALSGV